MPKSRRRTPCFLKVKCTDCEHEQVVFSHASRVIECKLCGKAFTKPTGGKAEIKTRILGVISD